MGVYTRDSPYYWLWLERPGLPALREATRILADAPTATQRQDQRRLAEQVYHARMTSFARADSGLTGPRPMISFQAYSEWYEANVTSHKAGATREREILKQLRKDFAQEAVSAISKERVLEWRTARAEDVSIGTVNRETDVLKHLLTTAAPKYLAESPIARLRRLRPSKEEPPLMTAVLTQADEKKLLKALKGSPSDRALTVLALDTLMRLSDALYLKWAHYHGGYLRIVESKVTRYEVPVSKRLRKVLDTLPRERGDEDRFIFAHRRLAEDPRDWRGSVRQMLERACARAGVKYGRAKGAVTWHSLRHTGASRMVDAGIDLRTVQELGGWKSLRQLSRYAHPTDQAKRRAVEAVRKAGA